METQEWRDLLDTLECPTCGTGNGDSMTCEWSMESMPLGKFWCENCGTEFTTDGASE